MPGKRRRGNKPASDENCHADHSSGSNSPAYPYEADDNLQKGYGGYDEERTSFDPRYEEDFDLDKNEFNERKNEYKNLNGDISEQDQK